jgi:hypothetical protein
MVIIWNMKKIQKKSKINLLHDPKVLRLVISILSLGEAMGILSPERVRGESSFDTVKQAARLVGGAGIGRQIVPYIVAAGEPDPEELIANLKSLEKAMEESPVPEREWPVLETALGSEALARLLGVSTVSVRRYRSGERRTPERIVARLHFLALLLADLSGTYTEEGVRLWFRRRRNLLGGRSPDEVLSGQWSPEDPEVVRLKELAHSLIGSPAT